MVQIYFDRFLPVNDSWPARFGIEVGDLKAIVAPRRAGDALFPDDVDRTLSSMELTLAPVSRPGGALRVRVGDRVVDRLEVTILDERLAPGPMQVAEQEMETFRRTAVAVADSLMSHCRVLARSPWLRGVGREYRSQDQRVYLMDPHTLTWFAGDDPSSLQPIAVYPGETNAFASSGALRAPETGSVQYPDLEDAMKSLGREPDICESLLVTAEERLMQLWLREAMVNLASAVEIATDRFIDRRRGTRDRESLLRGRESFAIKRLHRVPALLVGQSFRDLDAGAFDLVEAAYRTRNNVSHRGALVYRDQGGADVEVDEHVVRDFLRAARSAVDWLNTQ